jgi:hypothetical protein
MRRRKVVGYEVIDKFDGRIHVVKTLAEAQKLKTYLDFVNVLRAAEAVKVRNRKEDENRQLGR